MFICRAYRLIIISIVLCFSSLQWLTRELSKAGTLESLLRPRPDLVPVPGHCALALKGMLFSVQTPWCPEVLFQFAAVLPSCNHRNFKSQGNMGKSMADEILCKQVPVPEYGAWILSSERVPVPGYRAQVFVLSPLKCYVHIGARAQAPNPSTKSGRGLRRYNITETRRRQSWKGRKFKQMRLCADFRARSIHFICSFF